MLKASLTDKNVSMPLYYGDNYKCETYVAVKSSDSRIVIAAQICISGNIGIARLKIDIPDKVYISVEGTSGGYGLDVGTAAFFDAAKKAGIKFYEDRDKEVEIVIRGGGRKLVKEALMAIATELEYVSEEVAVI